MSHHFRRYTASELVPQLEKAGFWISEDGLRRTRCSSRCVFAGRLALRIGNRAGRLSENDMVPHRRIASGAISQLKDELIRRVNLPYGVSLLAFTVRSG